jgi:hypothetical protein
LSKEIPSKANDIIAQLSGQGIETRLIGALSIRLHSHKGPDLNRPISDIDFVAHSEDRKKVAKVLEGMGYAPATMFNAVNPGRLLFIDKTDRTRIDVFLDVFDMCHHFNFRGRFGIDKPTLPVADLLATKLQIVQINEKDLRDIITLMRSHELTQDDSVADRINARYVSSLCKDDWGIYKTFTMTIDRASEYLPHVEMEESEKAEVLLKLRRVREEIEQVPKTLKWKMRSKIGERQPWYRLPETRIVETGNSY